MGRTKPLFVKPFAAALLLAAIVAATPLDLPLGGGPDAAFIKVQTAAAKDGDSGRGGGDGGNSGSGGGGNSGRGGDDSGRGGGGDDGGGSSGRGGDDGHDDHEDSRGRGGREDGSAGDSHFGRNGERIEIEGDRIQVFYPGGWKEGIRNGIFLLKDPRDRTVVERRATAKDRARLRALAR